MNRSMKRFLDTNTILNGKYIIECVKNENENQVVYNATDLIMREDVVIYEFYPDNIVIRNETSDAIFVDEKNIAQYTALLGKYEGSIETRTQNKKKEIVKNYFRENNTGYLVVIEKKNNQMHENKKIKLIALSFLLMIALGELLYIGLDSYVNVDSNRYKYDAALNNLYVDNGVDNNGHIRNEKICVNEVDEQKIQYSESELLNKIIDVSGCSLFGTIKEDMYEKQYGECRKATIPQEGFLMGFNVVPCDGYETYIYDDFDADGYMELFALMRNMEKDYDISLWYSDGIDTYDVGENTTFNYGVHYSSCNNMVSHKGLKAIRYGKLKHVESSYDVHFYEPGGYHGDLGANVYSLNDENIINVSSIESGIMVENAEDGNVVAYKSDYYPNVLGEGYFLYKSILEIEDGNSNSEFSNIGDLGIVKTDVYYLNGKYNEYLAHEITEEEAQKYHNFEEQNQKCKQILKKVGYSQNKHIYDVSEYDLPYSDDAVTVDSIFCSDNDKLYLNYMIKCSMQSRQSSEYRNYAVSIVFSVENNELKYIKMYPGFRREISGVFD